MQKRVLVFGGSGLVGSRFVEIYDSEFQIKAPNIDELDILDKDQIISVLEDFKPDTAINFAAYTDVQGAEEQKGDRGGLCYRINSEGARNVSEVCKNKGVHLIHISTDYVFGGEKSVAPYTEEDKPEPKNWYGQTKYFAEQEVSSSGCLATIVRIAMPFSNRHDAKLDIARFFLGRLKNNLEVKAITDAKVTPIFADDVANALFVIIQKRVSGLYHVVSTNWTTPFDLAKILAKEFTLNESLVKPISLDEYNKNKKASLLRYSWLNPSKFTREFGDGILHTVEESVVLFKQEIEKG